MITPNMKASLISRNVRLIKKDWQKLEELSLKHEISIAQLIRLAIKEYIKYR